MKTDLDELAVRIAAESNATVNQRLFLLLWRLVGDDLDARTVVAAVEQRCLYGGRTEFWWGPLLLLAWRLRFDDGRVELECQERRIEPDANGGRPACSPHVASK